MSAYQEARQRLIAALAEQKAAKERLAAADAEVKAATSAVLGFAIDPEYRPRNLTGAAA